MKKIIHKYIWSYEKEEKWLNEMAAKGLALTSISFCRYEFEESLPGEYCIRVELLENLPNHPESIQYIKFIEETGAEHVGSVTRWVYFRKKTSDGAFDLFSDISSRISYLNRIFTLFTLLGLVNLWAFCFNMILYSQTHNPFHLISLINLVLALALLVSSVKINAKKSRLKRESQIHE